MPFFLTNRQYSSSRRLIIQLVKRSYWPKYLVQKKIPYIFKWHGQIKWSNCWDALVEMRGVDASAGAVSQTSPLPPPLNPPPTPLSPLPSSPSERESDFTENVVFVNGRAANQQQLVRARANRQSAEQNASVVVVGRTGSTHRWNSSSRRRRRPGKMCDIFQPENSRKTRQWSPHGGCVARASLLRTLSDRTSNSTYCIINYIMLNII